MKQDITVIIVDDDAGCIQRLKDDLNRFTSIEVVAACNSPEKAQKIIISEEPDIVFLDVEMPGMTGIELLKRIQPDLHADVKVVFYTAYNKYLLEALRASAFDYLKKPYEFDELKAIIDRYHSSAPKSTDNLEQSLHKLLGQDKNNIAIQTYSGLMFVSVEKIIMFDYSREYRSWQMMLADNNKPQRLRQATTTNDLLATGATFAQINKECIVNLNYIYTIENRSLRCLFCPPYDTIERVASRRYFKKIRDRMGIIL